MANEPEQTRHELALQQSGRFERFVNGLARFLAHVVHFVVDGPDPVEADEKPGMLEVWMPWPVRLCVVIAVVVAANMWRDTGIGQQIALGLQMGALIAVALAASFWLQFLVIDSSIAGLWLLPLPPGAALHIITFVNREIGHIKAIGVWLLLVLASFVSLPLQLGGAVAVILFGPPLLNGIARTNLSFLGPSPARKSSGDLLWRRRILIYWSTIIGLLLIALRAPSQVLGVLPLIGAVAGGLALRMWRQHLRNRRIVAEARRAAGNDQIAEASLQARAQFRRAQAGVASVADPLGFVLVLGALAGIIGASLWQRNKLDKDLQARLESTALPADGCSRAPLAPLSSDIALFLMGDTQTHELAGARFPGQTELAEVFVHSAVRPLPLDMLSLSTLGHFAADFRRVAEQRKLTGRSELRWAHLGDLADLGCANELERALGTLANFSTVPQPSAATQSDALSSVAAIAIGNHEMSFHGSFHWSPFWTAACSSGRLDKASTIERLERALKPAVQAQGGELVPIAATPLAPHSSALVSVVPLGISSSHGVLGVFLDSSDGRAFDRGNPGSFGAISALQIERAQAALERVRNAQGDAYREHPLYVLFQHVPFGELANDSQERLRDFIARLDERKELSSQPRVLALVSAHTHVASEHRHCVGHRPLTEITIGSTVDPPQQAALLEIGRDKAGHTSLSVRTLQSVSRSGVSCGESMAVSAATCRRVAARLRSTPQCAPLWAAADAEPERDCQELERAGSLSEDLDSLRTYAGPIGPTERYELQALQAGQLLQCVCREGRCEPPAGDPLKDDAYSKVLAPLMDEPEATKNEMQLTSTAQRPPEPTKPLPQAAKDSTAPAPAQELTCLAWAASAAQAHKSARMSLGEALRCAFDDPTLPAERIAVATLEATTCY